MTCNAYVSSRDYSKPGPCQNSRGITPIRIDVQIIPLCHAHRRMVEDGRQVNVKVEKP